MTLQMKLSATAALIALGALSFAGMPAQADELIEDDLIIAKPGDPSSTALCVGSGCERGELFEYDRLILKEENLTIKFDDTSTIVGNAANDWRILINDDTDFEPEPTNHFSIEDTTAGTRPFRINAGGADNTIVIGANGNAGVFDRLGIGTTTPASELHLKSGIRPSIRFQQDASGGFATASWLAAANHTFFQIGGTASDSSDIWIFTIEKGATNDALAIAADNDIGMGTWQPAGKLHTVGAGTQKALFESSDNGAVQLRLVTDSTNRRIVARNGDDTANMSQILLGDGEIKLAGARDSGDTLYATINASGIVTQGPTCNTPCDAVFDPDVFTVESIDEHAEYMWKNKHLLGVGPTSPELPFNVTEKTAGILNELEKAHIYIEQLHQRLEKTESRQVAKAERAEKLELAITDLRKEIAKLRATSQ